MLPPYLMPSLLADILVAAHLAIVVFVVGTPFLVFLGWPLKWRWIRNPLLRFGHLAIMAYIVQNAIRGELCFLTHWESALRGQAGETVEEASFVGRMLHSILFVQVDQDLLHQIYVGFGAFVLALTFLVRPKRAKLPADRED